VTVDLEYKIRLNNSGGTDWDGTNKDHKWLFVGFKNSLEALSRYDIYVNSNKIYSQAWVGPESFIYNAGLPQTIAEGNKYVHTCSKSVHELSPDVCGVYLDLTKENYTAGTEMTINIPVKINLHQILMLASVRYLPSFCGRWELELYPNWNNLVVLPVRPERTIGKVKADLLFDPAHISSIKDLTWSFTQIGKKFNVLKDYTYSATNGTCVPATAPITLTLYCSEGTLNQCLMSMTTFQLRFEVFEDLRRMYSEQPLIIPTNILHYSRFSGQPGLNTDNTIFHATLSQSLENCDSVFILVPFTTDQTTCFYQPYLRELRLSLGEFGTHPQRYVETCDNAHFLAMILDSLNLETSEITAMNKDVGTSITFPRRIAKFNAGTAGNIDVTWLPVAVHEKGETSDFFIGISLSQVGFQSGTVSSPNTNIPFIFDAVLDKVDGHARTGAGTTTTWAVDIEKIDTSIIALFLLDCALMIQVVAGSDVPVVKLTNKSIV
jgi:hypothetical protein